MSRYGRPFRHILVAFLFVHTSGWFSGAQGNRQFEKVLIEIPKPYDAVVAGIQARGGRVTRQFRHFDAIAAEIPVEALASVRALTGSATISKDTEIPAPTAAPAGHERSVGGKKVGTVTTVTVAKRSITSADTFSLNNAGSNLEQLRALHPELTGAGIIVAVIDSGIRPGFPLLDSDDSVIGGEDFVGDGLGWSDKKNDGHGTFVAGLISGNAEINTTGPLDDGIRA